MTAGQGNFYLDEIKISRGTESSITTKPTTTTSTTTTTTTTTPTLTSTTTTTSPTTTTTITTTPELTTEIELPDGKIFFCDFDKSTSINAQCGGSAFEYNSGSQPNILIDTTEAFTFGNSTLHVTDVKSICIFFLILKLFFKILIYFSL